MMLSNIMPFCLDIVTVVDNKNFNELKLLTIFLQQLSYFSPNHICYGIVLVINMGQIINHWIILNILNELSFFSRTAAFSASFLHFSSALPAFLHPGIIFIKQLCNYLAANLRCLPCLPHFSPFCSRFAPLINYTNITSFSSIISTKPCGLFGS